MTSRASLFPDNTVMTALGGLIWVSLIAACGMPDYEKTSPQQRSSSGMVSGTVSYRERIALPPDAVVEVVLLDVSGMDVAAVAIAEQTIDPVGQVPVEFGLVYDTADVDPEMQYAVRATIKHGNQPLFVTDQSYPVLTRGNSDRADLVLVRSGGGETPVADTELHGTKWELKELANERINRAVGQETHFLQFSDANETASGFVGCNNFTGQYTVSGTTLEFGNLARTMRACPSMALEDRFHLALAAVDRYEILGTRLILYGEEGELATFEAWYE